jgi:hypothetical protein
MSSSEVDAKVALVTRGEQLPAEVSWTSPSYSGTIQAETSRKAAQSIGLHDGAPVPQSHNLLCREPTLCTHPQQLLNQQAGSLHNAASSFVESGKQHSVSKALLALEAYPRPFSGEACGDHTPCFSPMPPADSQMSPRPTKAGGGHSQSMQLPPCTRERRGSISKPLAELPVLLDTTRQLPDAADHEETEVLTIEDVRAVLPRLTGIRTQPTRCSTASSQSSSLHSEAARHHHPPYTVPKNAWCPPTEPLFDPQSVPAAAWCQASGPHFHPQAVPVAVWCPPPGPFFDPQDSAGSTVSIDDRVEAWLGVAAASAALSVLPDAPPSRLGSGHLGLSDADITSPGTISGSETSVATTAPDTELHMASGAPSAAQESTLRMPLGKTLKQRPPPAYRKFSLPPTWLPTPKLATACTTPCHTVSAPASCAEVLALRTASNAAQSGSTNPYIWPNPPSSGLHLMASAAHCQSSSDSDRGAAATPPRLREPPQTLDAICAGLQGHPVSVQHGSSMLPDCALQPGACLSVVDSMPNTDAGERESEFATAEPGAWTLPRAQSSLSTSSAACRQCMRSQGVTPRSLTRSGFTSTVTETPSLPGTADLSGYDASACCSLTAQLMPSEVPTSWRPQSKLKKLPEGDEPPADTASSAHDISYQPLPPLQRAGPTPFPLAESWPAEASSDSEGSRRLRAPHRPSTDLCIKHVAPTGSAQTSSSAREPWVSKSSRRKQSRSHEHARAAPRRTSAGSCGQESMSEEWTHVAACSLESQMQEASAQAVQSEPLHAADHAPHGSGQMASGIGGDWELCKTATGVQIRWSEPRQPLQAPTIRQPQLFVAPESHNFPTWMQEHHHHLPPPSSMAWSGPPPPSPVYVPQRLSVGNLAAMHAGPAADAAASYNPSSVHSVHPRSLTTADQLQPGPLGTACTGSPHGRSVGLPARIAAIVHDQAGSPHVPCFYQGPYPEGAGLPKRPHTLGTCYPCSERKVYASQIHAGQAGMYSGHQQLVHTHSTFTHSHPQRASTQPQAHGSSPESPERGKFMHSRPQHACTQHQARRSPLDQPSGGLHRSRQARLQPQRTREMCSKSGSCMQQNSVHQSKQLERPGGHSCAVCWPYSLPNDLRKDDHTDSRPLPANRPHSFSVQSRRRSRPSAKRPSSCMNPFPSSGEAHTAPVQEESSHCTEAGACLQRARYGEDSAVLRGIAADCRQTWLRHGMLPPHPGIEPLSTAVCEQFLAMEKLPIAEQEHLLAPLQTLSKSGKPHSKTASDAWRQTAPQNSLAKSRGRRRSGGTDTAIRGGQLEPQDSLTKSGGRRHSGGADTTSRGGHLEPQNSLTKSGGCRRSGTASSGWQLASMLSDGASLASGKPGAWTALPTHPEASRHASDELQALLQRTASSSIAQRDPLLLGARDTQPESAVDELFVTPASQTLTNGVTAPALSTDQRTKQGPREKAGLSSQGAASVSWSPYPQSSSSSPCRTLSTFYKAPLSSSAAASFEQASSSGLQGTPLCQTSSFNHPVSASGAASSAITGSRSPPNPAFPITLNSHSNAHLSRASYRSCSGQSGDSNGVMLAGHRTIGFLESQNTDPTTRDSTACWIVPNGTFVRDSDGMQGGLRAQGSLPEDYAAAQATISIAAATANSLRAAPSGVSGQLTSHTLNAGVPHAPLPDFMVRLFAREMSKACFVPSGFSGATCSAVGSAMCAFARAHRRTFRKITQLRRLRSAS